MYVCIFYKMLTLSAIVNNYLHKHCFISYTTKNKTKYKSYRYINILIYTHIQTTRNTYTYKYN